MPAELDEAVEVAAAAAGMTYSAWLAGVARRGVLVQAGLDAVAEFERDHGAFSEAELAEAGAWAKGATERSGRSGTFRRQSA